MKQGMLLLIIIVLLQEEDLSVSHVFNQSSAYDWISRHAVEVMHSGQLI